MRAFDKLHVFSLRVQLSHIYLKGLRALAPKVKYQYSEHESGKDISHTAISYSYSIQLLHTVFMQLRHLIVADLVLVVAWARAGVDVVTGT